MGRSQREKGKRGEREAGQALRKIGCLNAARRVRQHDGDSDIIDAIPGVSFESKLERRVRIAQAMRQAIEQAGEQIPAVLHRETVGRGESANELLLTVRLADLPRLLNLYFDVRYANLRAPRSSWHGAVRPVGEVRSSPEGDCERRARAAGIE